MTLLTRLALRQIRAARARYLLTVLGTLLAAALLTAVLVGSHSVLRSLYGATAAQTGTYHWQTQGLPGETAARLLADVSLQRTGAVSQANPAVTVGGEKVPLVRVAGHQLEIQNTRLTDGGYPAPGQALLPDGLARRLGVAPGDTLRYTGPEGEGCVTVSGLYGESRLLATLGPDLVELPPIYLQLDTLPAGEKFAVYAAAQPLELRETGAAFLAAARAAGERLQAEGFGSWYNTGLLSFAEQPWVRPYDNSRFKAIVGGLRVFLLGLITAGAALLILNSFSISLAERRRTLGLLASAGATPRQKAGFLWREAVFVALPSIPLGVAAGCLGVKLAFTLVQPLVSRAVGWLGGSLTLCVFPAGRLLGAAALLTALVVALAAWRPARQAGRTSAMDSIRQQGEIRVRATRGREGALSGRLFGPAGVLAARFARRCHRHYRATVCSLTVVVVLAVAASGAVLYLERNFIATHGALQAQAELHLTSDGTADPTALPAWDRLLHPDTPIQGLTVTEEIYWGDLTLQAGQLSEAAWGEIFATADGYPMQPRITVLPDEDYAALAGAPAEPSGETLPVVLSNRQFIAGDFGRLDLNPQTTLTAGDTLAWSFNTMPLTLSVQAVTQRPEYAGQAGSAWQLTLYTSAGAAQAVFDRWYAERGGDPAASCRRNYTLAYETDAPAALLAELTDTVAAAGTEGGRLSAYPVNNAAEAAAYRSMLLVLRILAYGFVALIALLGTANIANTVSTGLTLRGRELAMLRSVGMEPADLRRMVLLQSLLYALQALAWGLPLAFVCLLAEYRLLRTAWAFSFTLPWAAILAVAAGLTGLTLLAALPALRALDRRGILTGLRQEE